MLIAVVTNDRLKEELLSQGVNEAIEFTWLDKPEIVPGATAYIDLLFTPDNIRLKKLKELPGDIIIINFVENGLDKFPENFVSINGWPGFLTRNVIEASCKNEAIKNKANKIFDLFGKAVEWTPDTPGFISARVVAMIINEAYLALQEGISTKNEIDTAMKLGTNYPYGPFEWAGIIGVKNIYTLLKKLSENNPRYTPADLLQKEALEV